MGTVSTTQILNYYKPKVNIVLRPLDDYPQILLTTGASTRPTDNYGPGAGTWTLS